MAKQTNTWFIVSMILIGVLVVGGIAGLIMFRGNPLACYNEFQHITTGTWKSDGKCCSGLTAQSPEGFTGGAWCVSSAYLVKCAIINNVQGIYAIEKVNNGNRQLLNAGYCELRCGGIAGISCPTNWRCNLDNPNIADSMGTCIAPNI